MSEWLVCIDPASASTGSAYAYTSASEKPLPELVEGKGGLDRTRQFQCVDSGEGGDG